MFCSTKGSYCGAPQGSASLESAEQPCACRSRVHACVCASAYVRMRAGACTCAGASRLRGGGRLPLVTTPSEALPHARASRPWASTFGGRLVARFPGSGHRGQCACCCWGQSSMGGTWRTGSPPREVHGSPLGPAPRSPSVHICANCRHAPSRDLTPPRDPTETPETPARSQRPRRELGPSPGARWGEGAPGSERGTAAREPLRLEGHSERAALRAEHSLRSGAARPDPRVRAAGAACVRGGVFR